MSGDLTGLCLFMYYSLLIQTMLFSLDFANKFWLHVTHQRPNLNNLATGLI